MAEVVKPYGKPKQIQANRQNALKSTGPKSQVGKMISSRNATRHGFYATSVVLPQEDREEFLRLARRLVTAYNPSGVLEEELVKTIIETPYGQTGRISRSASSYDGSEKLPVGVGFATGFVRFELCKQFGVLIGPVS